MSIASVCAQFQSVQNQVLTRFQDLEQAGFVFNPPLPADSDREKAKKSTWRVIRAPDNQSLIMAGQHWNQTAHQKIQLAAAESDIGTLFANLTHDLLHLGGYFVTPISFGFERRHNGMVLIFMGYALKDCLNGKPETCLFAKILKDLHQLEPGNGRYKMGSHTYFTASMEDVIRIHLLLSAPKTHPAKRKSAKPMAEIHRVWTYDDVQYAQEKVLKSWTK